MLTTDQAKKLRFAGYGLHDAHDVFKECKDVITLTDEEMKTLENVRERVYDILQKEGQL